METMEAVISSLPTVAQSTSTTDLALLDQRAIGYQIGSTPVSGSLHRSKK